MRYIRLILFTLCTLHFALCTVFISGCDSFFIRDTIGIPLKRPAVTYQISLATATDDVPAGFVVNLKRYLFAELSKRRMLGSREENPQMINIIVNYYKRKDNSGNPYVESIVDVFKEDEALRGKEVSTSVQKARSYEDVAKIHAKEIVRFVTEEKKN